MSASLLSFHRAQTSFAEFCSLSKKPFLAGTTKPQKFKIRCSILSMHMVASLSSGIFTSDRGNRIVPWKWRKEVLVVRERETIRPYLQRWLRHLIRHHHQMAMKLSPLHDGLMDGRAVSSIATTTTTGVLAAALMKQMIYFHW